MKNPNINMLLHIAIGDAYCAALEYIDYHEQHSELLALSRYFAHPKHDMPAGSYTDDTQMSIAIAAGLIEGRPDLGRHLPDFWAMHFLRAFKRDPRDGYSRGFQKFLERTETTEQFLKNIKKGSDKNGAAMRSVPLGVIPGVDELLSVAKTQAAVTHNSPWGILSSQVIALASHYTLYEDYVKGDLSHITEFVLDHLPEAEELRHPWEGKVEGPQVGKRTAHAVLSILRTTKTHREVILRTLLYKGDTDSVGAIALGIAGASHRADLPDFMEYALEPASQFSAKYLKGLGRLLMDSYTVDQ